MITCEVCGGNNLVKQEGVFVCQDCGTKYSVEEARKMIGINTEESPKTVKIDNANKINNLYQIARRAKESDNCENAAKYYDMILIEEPTSWEASFFVIYFKARNCKIGEIESAANSVKNCLDSVMYLIKNYENEDKQLDAVKEVINCSILIANMFYNAATSHYLNIDSSIRINYLVERCGRCLAAYKILYTLGDCIIDNWGDKYEYRQLAIDVSLEGIKLEGDLRGSGEYEGNKKIINYIIDGTVEERLNCAINMLYKENYYFSKIAFDNLIKSKIMIPIATLGLAVANALDSNTEADSISILHEAKQEFEYLADVNEYQEWINKIINAKRKSGIAAIHIAAHYLDEIAISFLLSLGVDVNVETTTKATPLFFIASKSHPGREEKAETAAKILIDNGASLNVTNVGGVALFNNETDEKVKILILKKNPNIVPGEAAASNESGGCYVATAVYGSYDCPEVWTLRRYRDYELSTTWYGRAFIHTYYAISPHIVKWFGETGWFKKMWRGKLDRMVKKLKEKGFESTPYEDKKW